MTQQDFDNAAATLATAAGITTCKTSNKGSEASAGGEFSAGGFGVSAGGSFYAGASTWDTQNTGCEQSTVATQQMYQSQRAIACALNESSASSSKGIKSINEVIVEAGRDLKVKNFRVNQSQDVKIVDLTQLTQSQIGQISNAVKMAADAGVTALQESKMGMGASPQGQKVLSDIRQQLTSENIQQTVNRTLSEVSLNVELANKVLIKAGRDISMEDAVFNQDIVLELTSNAILTNAVSSMLSNAADMQATATITAKQAAENLGAETLGRAAAEAIVELGKARVEAQSGSLMGLLGLLVIIVVLGIVYKFFGGFAGKLIQTWSLALLWVFGLAMFIGGISWLVSINKVQNELEAKSAEAYNKELDERKEKLQKQGQQFQEELAKCGEKCNAECAALKDDKDDPDKKEVCKSCMTEKCSIPPELVNAPEEAKQIPKYQSPPSPTGAKVGAWFLIVIGMILLSFAIVSTYKRLTSVNPTSVNPVSTNSTSVNPASATSPQANKYSRLANLYL
jgi:hypothetical protein